MTLPYPDQSYDPFTEFPAEDFNQTMANITSLAAGGFNAGALTAEKLANKGFKELARATLSSPADSMIATIDDPTDFMILLFWVQPTGGSANIGMRVNGDSAVKYAYRFSSSGAADTLSTPNNTMFLDTNGAITVPMSGVQYIMNFNGAEKLFVGEVVSVGSAGAGNFPNRREYVQKFADTGVQISQIELYNPGGTGDFGAGSEFVILGVD